MSYLKTLTRNEDGDYLTADGVTVGDAVGALSDKLGICGCGCPELALGYILEALRVIDMRGPDNPREHSKWYREVKRPSIERLFKDDPAAEYFAWYMLDHLELTEHGSSVPGWLSSLGKDILADLEELRL